MEQLADLTKLSPGVLTLLIVLGVAEVTKLSLGRWSETWWASVLLPLVPVAVGGAAGLVPGWLSEHRAMAVMYGLAIGCGAVVLFSAGKRPVRALLKKHLPAVHKLLGGKDDSQTEPAPPAPPPEAPPPGGEP